MTAATLCRRMLERAGIECDVTMGAANAYIPGERTIVLNRHVYKGTTRKAFTLAAHEVGHAAQEHAFGWIAPALRWLMPGRLLLEWDASRRARGVLAANEINPAEDVLDECWKSYVIPALWQTGIAAAIAAYLFLTS